MSSFAHDSAAFPEDRHAAVIKVAMESRNMLGLVNGCPEFERLATILERARSEAIRILNLHGLSLPPGSQETRVGRDLVEDKGSPEA